MIIGSNPVQTPEVTESLHSTGAVLKLHAWARRLRLWRSPRPRAALVSDLSLSPIA